MALRIVLVLLLASVPLLSDSEWTKAIRTVDASLVKLTGDPITVPNLQNPDQPVTVTPTCTGFSINEFERYILTASHCIARGLRINGERATVLWADDRLDVAVLKSSVRKPAVRTYWTPQLGQPIGSLGYGYALSRVIFRAAHVSLPTHRWPSEMYPVIMLDTPSIKGMSGGPAFDLQGRVVGVIISTDPASGWIRPITLVHLATQKFWAFP